MREFLLAFVLCGAGFSLRGASSPASDPIAAGRKRFQIRCSGCHGTDGTGGERAPAIGHGDRSRLESDTGIRDIIRSGIPEAGMPAFDVPPDELDLLVAFVRSRVLPAALRLPRPYRSKEPPTWFPSFG